MMKKPLLILVGPTAVGKTDVSLELAKALNGEIISADSMQVYKYMDIGTAKLAPEEMEGIKHHIIDVVYPDEDFSAALFKNLAEKCIDDIVSSKKLPIIVGGTGLYVHALTHNLDFTEIICDSEYRSNLQDLANKYGNSYIHNMLKDIDIESYYRLHENNIRRIIRALEVYKHTGKTMSDFQKESKERPVEYDYCIVGLNMDRQKLYERINKRVNLMTDKGLVEEVRKLLDMGYDKSLTSMQGLGYKEIVTYLQGECTLEEAVYKLKLNTRHFAKRQLTWFRRQEVVHWVDRDDYENTGEIVENITQYVAGKLKLI